PLAVALEEKEDADRHLVRHPRQPAESREGPGRVLAPADLNSDLLRRLLLADSRPRAWGVSRRGALRLRQWRWRSSDDLPHRRRADEPQGAWTPRGARARLGEDRRHPLSALRSGPGQDRRLRRRLLGPYARGARGEVRLLPVAESRRDHGVEGTGHLRRL